MKVSNTVSTLACLALLSTYSINGFAKTGNGDSYSGPTLTGDAVSLGSDKPIKNSELSKVIKSCLTTGGKDSYLLKILTPLYGNDLTLDSFDREYYSYYDINALNQHSQVKTSNYFQKRYGNPVKPNEYFEHGGESAGLKVYPDSLTLFVHYKTPTIYLKAREGFTMSREEIVNKVEAIITLGSNGMLRIQANGKTYHKTSKSIFSKEWEKNKALFPTRTLLVKNMPVFTATQVDNDVFDSITGDFLRVDDLLKDLQMVYDRNGNNSYSPVINISYPNKRALTQIMAPNAEFADCVADQLGNL